MAGSKSGGIVGTIWKTVIALIIIGASVALLRAFDWDVFSVINWVWSWLTTIVDNIANFFTGRSEFQEIVKAP